MITVSDVSLKFGERTLFKDVNLKFTPGNCYGIIGANGAGKSTFLKVLDGELEHDSGQIIMTPGERMAVLKQDHFAFDEYSVKDTVMMGHPKLYECSKARDEIYAKEDFTEEDGIKSAELEAEFGELGGYEAENQIEQMLSGLGLEEEYHDSMMSELDESQKVRVLLAQAIFGEPDILLLDEPTNGLDIESITWLENFLMDFPNTVIVVSHDRHFLNTVCTTICDIDFGKITQFTGNYDFWYQMSQILQKQAKDQQKKNEDKMKDLKEEERNAKVVCNLVYYDGNQIIIGEGVIKGKISLERRGSNGFGFDEIFELDNGKTLAELSTDEKNEISARGLAAEDLKMKLKNIT